MSSKQKHREDTGPLLIRTVKLVTYNAEKAEIVNSFFASTFTDMVGPQVTGSGSYNNASVDPPIVEEGLVCSLLQGQIYGPGQNPSQGVKKCVYIYAVTL